MAANGMFGAGKDGLINAPDPSRMYSLSMAEIAVFDTDCYDLLTDLTVIIDLAKVLNYQATVEFHRLLLPLYLPMFPKCTLTIYLISGIL